MNSTNIQGIIGIFVVFLFIILIGIFIALQLFLSNRKSSQPGLVLPILCFVLSFVTVWGFEKHMAGSGGTITRILRGLLIFLISNIPTLSLACIYYGYRQRKKKDNNEII